MLGMLFRIATALALAFFVSGLVGERLSVSDEAFLEPGLLARIAERAWSQANLAWPFALFGVALGEVFKVRSLLYYLAAGALVAVAAVSFDQGAWNFDLASNWLPRWRDGVLTSGVLGGLIYWMTHGYKAGWPAPSAETISKEPMAALLGPSSGGKGWLAGALALAAAAGLGVWTLDEDRFSDAPARKAESEVSAALAGGGYPWAKLKISDDVGEILGQAPDERAKAAAFQKAQQITQPMTGASGVMTALENKLTAPDPAAVAAAQAAARSLAEAEAAKRKAEEDAKRAAEAEVKRKAEEQARRVAAAEAEGKRKAEESRRAALAAESEAKRKAEEEAKRAAAELEAKRVAAEAEAKRKADEEARKVALDAEAAKRKAEEDAKRVAAEADAKRKAEDDAKRVAAEAEAKRKADEDTKRIAAEADAKRKAEAEAKKVAAETEAIKKKVEADAKRIAAEAEAAKRKAELEAKMAEAKAKRATDDAAKKLAAAMADKKNDIPAKVIAAVPAGPVPAKSGAPQAAQAPAAGSGAGCAAEPLGVIRETRIALKRSDLELTPEINAQLDKLAQAIKSCGDAVVQVAGYSTRGFDKRAKTDHSRLLASRIADELGRRGVPKERLKPAGLGAPAAVEGMPDLPGRRVELALLAPAKPAAAAPANTAACTSDPAALRLGFGSSQERPGGSYRAEVDRIAAILRACGNARFVVEGHTDATGSDDLNKRLSQRRADLVKRALVRRGVPEASITATGLGSAKPLDTSGTPAAKAANRRVDIVVAAAPPAAPATKAPGTAPRK